MSPARRNPIANTATLEATQAERTGRAAPITFRQPFAQPSVTPFRQPFSGLQGINPATQAVSQAESAGIPIPPPQEPQPEEEFNIEDVEGIVSFSA